MISTFHHCSYFRLTVHVTTLARHTAKGLKSRGTRTLAQEPRVDSFLAFVWSASHLHLLSGYCGKTSTSFWFGKTQGSAGASSVSQQDTYLSNSLPDFQQDKDLSDIFLLFYFWQVTDLSNSFPVFQQDKDLSDTFLLFSKTQTFRILFPFFSKTKTYQTFFLFSARQRPVGHISSFQQDTDLSNAFPVFQQDKDLLDIFLSFSKTQM